MKHLLLLIAFICSGYISECQIQYVPDKPLTKNFIVVDSAGNITHCELVRLIIDPGGNNKKHIYRTITVPGYISGNVYNPIFLDVNKKPLLRGIFKKAVVIGFVKQIDSTDIRIL